MSKGSNVRPSSVDRDTWSRNWERTFSVTRGTDVNDAAYIRAVGVLAVVGNHSVDAARTLAPGAHFWEPARVLFDHMRFPVTSEREAILAVVQPVPTTREPER